MINHTERSLGLWINFIFEW